MVWAATKYSLVLVAGEKINGKMACALTDDGKTIGSYIHTKHFYFSRVVDPYLLHIRYHQ